MQLATDGDMLNFGYWSKDATSPIDAQNRLCDEIGKIAELNSAKTLPVSYTHLTLPTILIV